MASFGKPRVAGRIVLLVLLIAALVTGGIVWFDFLGLIDAKDALGPAYRALGLKTRLKAPVDPLSPDLLEEERLGKRLEALLARSDELDQRSADAQLKDSEIAQKAQEL